MDNISEDQRSDRRTRFDNSQQLAAVGGMLAVSGNHKGDQAQKQRRVTLALETQACHLANWCYYELEQCRDCQQVVTCSQQCIFTRRLAEVAIKEGITLHIELCVIAQLYICAPAHLCNCIIAQGITSWAISAPSCRCHVSLTGRAVAADHTVEMWTFRNCWRVQGYYYCQWKL